MISAIAKYGLPCVLLCGLLACSENGVEPGSNGASGRYSDGVSPADSATMRQLAERLRLRAPLSLSEVPAPPGTRQCRSVNFSLSRFDPNTYTIPFTQPLQPCVTTYFGAPHYYQIAADNEGNFTGPVTLTFSQPVYSLIIEAYGAFSCSSTDFGQTTAYNSAGEPVDVSTFVIFDREGDCGDDDVGGLRMDTVRFTGPVKSVTITAPTPTVWQLPPPYVDLTGRLTAIYNVIIYESPCPPVGELVLDDPAVRAALLQALTASRPTEDGVNRREHGGYVYLRDDGTPFLVEETQAGFSECRSNLLMPSQVPGLAGAHFIGYWHTHPNKDFEPYYSASCQLSAGPGQIAKAGPRDQDGGGSEGDWLWADSTNTSMYVISLGERVYRLDDETPRSQWGNNPNKWKFDNRHSCLSLR